MNEQLSTPTPAKLDEQDEKIVKANAKRHKTDPAVEEHDRQAKINRPAVEAFFNEFLTKIHDLRWDMIPIIKEHPENPSIAMSEINMRPLQADEFDQIKKQREEAEKKKVPEPEPIDEDDKNQNGEEGNHG